MAKTKRTSTKVQSRQVQPSAVQTAFPVPTIMPGAYPLTVIEAAGIAAVRRCVGLIANAIAGQPWTEWDGKVQVDPVSRIVKRPASLMSRREWVWRCIASMALDDVAYLYMVGGVDEEGVPGSLIPMPRDAISPAGLIDPFGIFPPTSYSISGVPGTVSGEYVIPMRSVFWPGVPQHLVGILRMARNSMMQAWSSDSYAARFWQAGGTPATVITTEQELTDPQADGIGRRYRDRRSMGPDFPAVFGKGAHLEAFGADLAALTGVEARREISIEIANLFGVPARYVNVTPQGTSQTYSNLNDEALSLDRFTLAGFYEPIEDVITDLLPDPRFMQVDMTKLTRGGQEARFRAWAIATGNKPWMMPEEVRVLEGLAPNDDIEKLEAAQVEGAEAAADSFANRETGGAAPKVDAAASKVEA